MARIGPRFNAKINAALSSKIDAALASVSQVSACAGIKDDFESAIKARLNHYGSFTMHIPARRWVDMAEIYTAHSEESAMLQDLIKSMLKSDTGPGYKRSKEIVPGLYRTDIRYHDVIATPFEKGIGPARFMEKIAEGMKAVQESAILSTEFRAGPSYGGDPYHNAKRTIRLKGFDWPMVNTGAMASSIRAWVEPAGGRNG